MSLEGIAMGVIGLLLGAAFTFAGFRWFMIILPIFGLFVGFMTGAGLVSSLLNEGILTSILGIGVGIVLGIVFALFSWFYWWGAVVVVGGILGYEAMHWLLVLIGFNPNGFLVFLICLAAGAAVAIVALVVNAPKLVAILLTSFAGAAWLAAGIALIPGILKPDDLVNGPLAAIYTQGWFWILLWGVLGAAGVFEQLMTTTKFEHDLVAAYATRKPPM